MTLIGDIAAELYSMFLADARLSGAILALVAVIGLLVDGVGFNAGLGGAVLIAGCLAIIVTVTAHEARQRRNG